MSSNMAAPYKTLCSPLFSLPTSERRGRCDAWPRGTGEKSQSRAAAHHTSRLSRVVRWLGEKKRDCFVVYGNIELFELQLLRQNHDYKAINWQLD